MRDRRTTSVPEGLAEWLRSHSITQGRLLVGVSGGADSVALLRACDACRRELSLDVHVAHLDHGWRAESGEDAAWVANLCAQLQVAFASKRIDVPGFAETAGRGLEETARARRYDFFRHEAAVRDCSWVAVAHTQDDQAETILHHLVRGTGLAGLSGMSESRPLAEGIQLIRPLLNVCRADLRNYLATIGQPFRDDATNLDSRFTRSRVRHGLLPLLQSEFNPQVIDALSRLGRQISETQQIIEHLAREPLRAAIVEASPDAVVLNVAPLAPVERHLVREAFRLLWTDQNWPRQRMGFEHWERLAELAQSARAASSLSLPHGLTAARRGSRVKLTRHSRGDDAPE